MHKSGYPAERVWGLFWPVQSVMLTAPGEPKLATYLFLRTLGFVCMVSRRGPRRPSYPCHPPPLNPPAQMGIIKSETVSTPGICKGKWMQFPRSDDFIMLSAYCSFAKGVVCLSAQGQAWGRAMAVACPTLRGHIVRRGREN